VNSGRDPNPYGHVIRFAEDPRSDAASRRATVRTAREGGGAAAGDPIRLTS
jgi:hypothetical protein